MAKLVVKKKSEENEFMPHVLRMADLAAEKKAVEIKAYDLRGLTLVADAFILCTVTSDPQMRAVYNSIREGMKEVSVAPFNVEGTHQDGWLLLDYSAVIVHIFKPEARAFYDLDGLWADAVEIPLELD